MARSGTSMYGALGQALLVDSAEECAEILEGVSAQLSVFRRAMPAALRGEWSPIVVVVNRWHGLVEELLEAASDELPELVTKVDDHFGILTAAHELSSEPVGYLDHLISDVPFSPLVGTFGPDVGVGVVAVESLRLLLPGISPLLLGQSLGWPDMPKGTDVSRYRRLVDLALRSMQPPLARIRELFDLNTAEIADLFNVRRQAVEQWEHAGDVPAGRREKLGNLLWVGELLDRKLRPGRLPLVARKRADAYGGINLLDMVRADRDGELRELTERSLDWSSTA